MPKKSGGRRHGPRPAWLLCVGHALALGLALVLYALPHHVLPRAQQDMGVVSSRANIQRAVQTAEIAPTGTPAPMAADADQPDAAELPEATPEPTPEPVGSFRNKFADKFTDGQVVKTNNSYQSANLNVTFQKHYFDDIRSRVYLVDIYVADITCLRTVFAKDTYGRGIKEWITKMTKRTGCIAAMNSDYYGSRDFGVVVRNGTLYRDRKNIRDVAVLYWDGSFKTIAPEDFDVMAEMENGAYQCWHFGPRLLDDEGHAMTKFNADTRMLQRHPRSAFGYYEPGHYCFVVVDGRHEESVGVNMTDLSRVMEGLGCAAGYNMDGGQTSLLSRFGDLWNRPSGGGKSTSDYIVVMDDVQD